VLKYLFFSLVFLIQTSGFCQLYIGSLTGLQLPGMQDLKFKVFDRANNYKYLKMVKTTKTKSSTSVVKGLSLAYQTKKYGFKLTFVQWRHITTATAFEDVNYIPSFYTIKEARKALYISFLRKFKDPIVRLTNADKAFSFVEGGYGFARTVVEHGLRTTQPTLQVAYGIVRPFSNRLSGVFTFKYVLTSDVDNRAPILGEDTIVDTSGAPALLRNGAHFDTRYHMFLLGLQYQIF